MQKYRPEIDGLRAVAVIAVLLFHAKLGFPGGFVGVDVFFVISGFLITSIILKAVKASEFSSLDFWERRTRRIAPALIVTILVTVVATWFVYLPNDFVRVGSALIAQSGFISNVYHLRAADYFGPAADSLPLLHTWSLAVEEQFYIVFPLALLILMKWRRNWLNGSILAVFVLSLALAIWATPNYSGASFYLLPTRAWELLLGSLLAAFPAFGQASPKWAKETLALGGLAAMGASIFLYDSNTPFPGVYALAPCLGAAAFIWANTWGLTAAGKFLAWRPFVFTGQISYSLYLVHWPLLILSMYWFRDEMSVEKRLGLVAAAYLLAVLSWALVENPFRKKRVFAERRALFAFAGTSMVALLGLGAFVRLSDGFPNRFSPEVLRYADMRNHGDYLGEETIDTARQQNFTKFGAAQGPATCLIWGDSHAMAMAPALDALGKESGTRGYQAAFPATAPLLGYVSNGKSAMKQNSVEFSERVVDFAIEQKVKFVVMTCVWSTYAKDPSFESCLKTTLDKLTSSGIKVVIVLDVARQTEDVPWLLARASLMGRDVRKVGVPLERHREMNRKADDIFRRINNPNVVILDPATRFVDHNGLWRAEYGGQAMYKDASHLSLQGALRVTPLFQEVLGKPGRHTNVLSMAADHVRGTDESR